MSTKTLIFGPTGGVGSSAALAAQKAGAKVYLCMRDTTKVIPAITSTKEKEGGFERVQGDLTKPDTLKGAATKTGAKHAFVYLTFGVDMRPAFEALKEGGIEFVVFLSSTSIQEDIREVTKQNILGFMHAQAEIALEEVFGKGGYVAVRPAFFATNAARWYAKGIKEVGVARLFYPELTYDNITPEDIGKVAGKLVAAGPKSTEGKDFIRLCGPELLSQREMVRVIGSIVGKEIKIVEIGKEECLMVFEDNGMPKFVAQTLVDALVTRFEAGGTEMFEGEQYKEAMANVKNYSGEEPMYFVEWVKAHKETFA